MSRDFFYRGERIPYVEEPEPAALPGIVREPVRPEEVRARVRAYEATRPEVSGSEILRRIRASARDLVTIPGTDVSYSPVALAMNAIPFSDELVGIATDALTDADYDEAQNAAEGARAVATLENPGSAILGGLAQAAITAPLALTGAPTGSTALIRAANAASPAAALGGTLGAAGGALTAAMRGEDRTASERASAAIEAVPDSATAGGFVGLGAGLLGAGGRALAATPSGLLGVPSRILGSALTGAGYAAAASPDASVEPITNIRGTVRDAAESAPVGAAIGGALGTLSEAATAVPRARAYARHLFRDIPEQELAGRRGPPIPPTGGEADETLGMMHDALPGIAAEAQSPVAATSRPVGSGYADIARDAERSAVQSSGDLLEDLVRSGLRRDPAVSRLQTLGLSQAEINRAAARYGNDPRRLVAAAREHGLLPNAPYMQEQAAQAVDAVRLQAGRDVGVIRDALGNLDASVSGASIADDVQAMAENLSQLSSPASRNRARVLSEIAEDLRYGPGVRPAVDSATGEIIIPPERSLTAAELLKEIDAYSRDLSRAWRSTDPNVDQEALMDVRRILAGYRDRLARSEIDPSAIGLPPGATQDDAANAIRTSNRAYQVTSALDQGRNGVPAGDARQSGMFRGWLESVAGGQLGAALGPVGYAGGRMLGFLGGRTVANYLPSVIATVNEGGFGPGALARSAESWPAGARRLLQAAHTEPVGPVLDWMTQGVERQLQVDPSAFGRLAGVLEESARRGTLGALVAYLNANQEAVERMYGAEAARAVQDVQTRASAEAQQAADAARMNMARRLRLVPEADAGTATPGSVEEDEARAVQSARERMLERLGHQITPR